MCEETGIRTRSLSMCIVIGMRNCPIHCILVRIKEDYPMLSWEEFLSSLRAYVQDFQKTKSCYKGKKLIETNNVISVLMDL